MAGDGRVQDERADRRRAADRLGRAVFARQPGDSRFHSHLEVLACPADRDRSDPAPTAHGRRHNTASRDGHRIAGSAPECPGSAGIVAGSHGFEEDRGFEEEGKGMDMWHNGLIVPLASFVMVILIVAIVSVRRMREKELEAHRELRMREMEHEQKMKQMEIERSRLELEKAKVTKNT